MMADDDFIKQTNEHEVRMAEIRASERHDRREWWITVLSGAAVVLVILGIVGGIVFTLVSNGWQNSRVNQACVAGGGSWVNLNGKSTCIHMEVSR